MKEKKFTLQIGGKKLEIHLSDLAKQANSSVLARYGDTVVLATVTLGEKREVNYLPLTVEYDEKFYAVGKIKGSRFIKREGKPSDEAIINARLIDRSIRPLFNQKIRNDIQVVISVLSFDKENDPDVLALLATSVALQISDIPWEGPIGALRIAKIGEEFVINPTYQQREASLFNIIVSGKDKLVNMIEAEARQASEEDVFRAMEKALPKIKEIIDFQNDIASELKVKKRALETEELVKEIKQFIQNFSKDKLEKILFQKDTLKSKKELRRFKQSLKNKVRDKFGPENIGPSLNYLEELEYEIAYEKILKGTRPDGRDLDQIRPIETSVSLLPRVHGTGLFCRGLTQALSIVTLGSPGEKKIIEGMEVVGTKRFMHHYNFPPFCAGETAPMRGPGRREIGHGLLAERALKAVIPEEEKFPYTIRIVTEILSSNGSTSMASTCSSSLALMDAGVPIKEAVAGISIGIVYKDENNYKLLTDIQGIEDHAGHMDFKVAGTKSGITAIQMDVKTEGIPLKILREALYQAKKARLAILEKMTSTISRPRPELSKYAPRVFTIKIPRDKIREIIGQGGVIINKIVEESNVKIDIEENGTIFVTSEDAQGAQKAINLINNIIQPLTTGQVVEGTVADITDFGAFIEYAPGKQGLLHISQIRPGFVKNVEKFMKIGQKVKVKVIGVDQQGRVSFSIKALNQNGGEKFKTREGQRPKGGNRH